MTILIIIIIVYGLLLFLPLIGGFISYLRNKNEPIFIDQGRVKDPRFFSKSFARLFFEKWSNYDRKGDLFFSKNEKVILADDTEIITEECDSIVVAERHDFIPNKKVNFNKEVMVLKNAYIYGEIQLRAIRAQGDMIVGQGVKVIRWIDAEGNLFIRDNCDLGLSATSATILNIGKNVHFRRLFAPIIYIAMPVLKPNSHSDYKYSLLPSSVRKNINSVSANDLEDSNIAEFSVISKKDVKIYEHVILQGHIKSDKGVRLLDYSFICGNIFAKEDIYIGKNVVVMGNVFTHGNIYLEDEVTIGQEHHINSLVAGGRIDFGLNSKVYGYVHSELGGVVFKEKISELEIYERITNEERKYGISEEEKFHHVPHTKNEYNYEHPVGFRYDSTLTEVVVPNGVEYIRRSMFFECKNLTKISLPVSIKVIEDFAFYGCDKLKEVNFESSVNMTRIGKSAFENCSSLEVFEFPDFVRRIEPSSFSGCSSLKDFKISPKSFLEHIDSHAFKCCLSLESFNIPSFVQTIGLSAFYNCINLKNINIPKTCREIGDYAFNDCKKLDVSGFSMNTLSLLQSIKGNPIVSGDKDA